MAALFTFFLKIKVFQFLRKRPTPSAQKRSGKKSQIPQSSTSQQKLLWMLQNSRKF